jgi:hypothetical protein
MLAELRGKAFSVWYEAGCSIAGAIKKLTSEGYAVTRQTLANWRDEDGWEDRAARLDAEAQAAKDALLLSDDEQLLSSLKRQHEQYERYFVTLEKPDPQATYAHNGLIRTIQDITQKTASYKRAVFAEFFEGLLDFCRNQNPKLSEMLEPELTAYLKHIKNTI